MKCANTARNCCDISKGEFQIDICEFESSQPSQRVRSLLPLSGSNKLVRYLRDLAEWKRVSAARISLNLATAAAFWA
jgi:hypothetical protein